MNEEPQVRVSFPAYVRQTQRRPGMQRLCDDEVTDFLDPIEVFMIVRGDEHEDCGKKANVRGYFVDEGGER
eukprot:39795-Eustigmatos_ZCMA.PRE.1